MRNYKFSIDLDLADFADYDFLKLKHNGDGFGSAIWEEITDWESPFYYNTPYYEDEGREEAIQYLKTTITATDQEINDHMPDIETAIVQSMDQAWHDSVESQIFELYESKAKDPSFSYSAMCYVTAKGEVTPHFYEASYIRYFFSRSLWRSDYFDPTYYDTIKDGEEAAEDDIYGQATDRLDKITTGRYGDIDSAQDNADTDRWFSLFSDYEEITAAITAERRTRTERIKAMIRNKVPLEYRASM